MAFVSIAEKAMPDISERGWYVRATGASPQGSLSAAYLGAMKTGNGGGFIGFREAAVRAELRSEPDLLREGNNTLGANITGSNILGVNASGNASSVGVNSQPAA